uniref:Immunoglobulin domain-containing protein n=1 Tax=Melopsittacus undulatus TaxID=13146 RepID=A0A8V5FSN0_MELUD
MGRRNSVGQNQPAGITDLLGNNWAQLLLYLYHMKEFHFHRGTQRQPTDVITETEVVHALPGTDVTLLCSFPKPHGTYIIQTQWSKTDGTQLTRIAVYHPVYGTHYFTFPEASYNVSVSFSTRNCCSWDETQALCSPDPDAKAECTRWALHLKNVTISLSGQYECSFATYPYGTKAAKIQLLVKAEEEQHNVKEVWLNQTLEIPCLGDTASEDLSHYPLKWLVVSSGFHLLCGLFFLQEQDGMKEELVTKEPSCPAVYRNSSMLYGQRVLLGVNNALKLFPTRITDNGKVFSCHVVSHPERVQKSSTTVRVFGKELTPAAHLLALGKVTLLPGSEKAFAAFPFLFLFPQGISVEQEDSQDNEGFYQLRSTLVFQGTHQTSKTFLCVCLFSFAGNGTWNISSKEIFVTFGRFFIGRTHLKCQMITPNICILCDVKYREMPRLWKFHCASSSHTLNSPTVVCSSSLCSTIGSKPRFASSLRTFSGVLNMKASHFPWPTVVAVLLLSCSFLIALGIRKWCQYQKEIKEFLPYIQSKPPLFKFQPITPSPFRYWKAALRSPRSLLFSRLNSPNFLSLSPYRRCSSP